MTMLNEQKGTQTFYINPQDKEYTDKAKRILDKMFADGYRLDDVTKPRPGNKDTFFFVLKKDELE